MRRGITGCALAVLIVAALAAAGVAYYRQTYPYGRSHCCDKALALALLNYADRHDGWFPKGEATPEASLSLLHRDQPEIDAYLLRGKTVAESVVRDRLSAGELLTRETCGWHYVEGLRRDDDGRLALFWDKVGLGHNGERLPRGGHHVAFVAGDIKYIPGNEWEHFLTEQQMLFAAMPRFQ